MVGVNPGELLCAYMCKQCKHVQTCANASHNKEIVSPQLLFGKQTVIEMVIFEVFTAVLIAMQVF
jgi:hypothetical protein